MRKLLFLIVGFLGIIFVIELGIFFWQKNNPRPSIVSVSLAPSVTPVPVSLPLSSQNKPDIKFVTLDKENTDKGYVAWQEADFFFYAKKDDNNPVYPFSFIGKVKKTSGTNRLEFEAKTKDKTIYTIKVELLPNHKIIDKTNQGKAISLSQVKAGNRMRVALFWPEKRNNDYFLVRLVYLLSS
ncbi:MAG: hypothetical protein FJ009_02060 [Chloroflexi bacterium]|nr:hypothetical protein [Chloroflexota bacterium]